MPAQDSINIRRDGAHAVGDVKRPIRFRAMDKRIAYLTSVYARAGDTFIRREVEELRRLGWTVHTFSIRRPDAAERVSEEIAREQEGTDYVLERGPLRLVAALARVALRSPRRTLRALAQARAIRWPGVRSWIWHGFYFLEAAYLAGRLEALGVELLHDHIAMNSATVAMLASTMSGVPFSMTVHGLELVDAGRWALGAKVAASAATVCVSSHAKAQCMMFTDGDHWHKFHEVRCGLDASFLGQAPVPVPSAPRLACVGRLSPEKGHVVLVEAVASLLRRGVALELTIVGDGPSRPDVERAVRRHGLEGAVRLVGWRSSEDVKALVLESRALVVPSFSEGIPVAIMEAFALRRPVIATYVGGVPELVRPGENGWLIPAGSAEELADALQAALETPTARLDEMGKRGLGRVLERHDLRTEVRELTRVLEGVIGGEGSRSARVPRARDAGRSLPRLTRRDPGG